MGTLRVDEWQSQFEALPELAQNIWAAAPIPVIAIGIVLLLLFAAFVVVMQLRHSKRKKRKEEDKAICQGIADDFGNALRKAQTRLDEKKKELEDLHKQLRTMTDHKERLLTSQSNLSSELDRVLSKCDHLEGRLKIALKRAETAEANIQHQDDVTGKVPISSFDDAKQGRLLSKLKEREPYPGRYQSDLAVSRRNLEQEADRIARKNELLVGIGTVKCAHESLEQYNYKAAKAFLLDACEHFNTFDPAKAEQLAQIGKSLLTWEHERLLDELAKCVSEWTPG